jgi:NAD(P)-dependent dehydrogenase (short-subunit alcohol dehydrogenase family)
MWESKLAIDLKGKTAFVTGAASGIGLSMARALGAAGAKVMIADIDEKAMAAAKADLEGRQIQASTVLCDVTERTSVQNAALKTIADFGKVHVICNNAGIGVGGPWDKIRPGDWDWVIDVNLKGVVYGVETFAPLIVSHGEGGHIVNTASMAGIISGPGMEPYSATKYAVVAMSEGWRSQFDPLNIGVSVLCPGFVSTHIYDSYRSKQQKYGGTAPIASVDPAAAEASRQAIINGMDPDIVGRFVVEGIQKNRLYMFPHREMRAFVEMRFQQILEGYDQADASEALSVVEKVDQNAYRAEITRRREEAAAARARAAGN